MRGEKLLIISVRASTAWSASAASRSVLPARPNLLAKYLAIVMDCPIDCPSTSSTGSCPRGRVVFSSAQASLYPAVFIVNLSLGEDEPGQLGAPLQVEVCELDTGHGGTGGGVSRVQ